MIRTLGALVDAREEARLLADWLDAGLDLAREEAAKFASRPRIYFEEWDEPSISAIRWVSELIDIAGGSDVFAERSVAADAKGRIVDGNEVIARAPDIIIGSWCGKKFRAERVAARPGFAVIPAVRDGALFEVKSSIILQPGPAALTDGLAALQMIVRNWSAARHSTVSQPSSG
jgi:iron complex transport system substrate-binding protein